VTVAGGREAITGRPPVESRECAIDAGGSPIDAGGDPAGRGDPPAGACGSPTRAGGSPAEAGGSPAEAGGDPAEGPGAPLEAGGSPAGARGSPAETGGAPVEAKGGPVDARRRPARASGDPSVIAGAPVEARSAPHPPGPPPRRRAVPTDPRAGRGERERRPRSCRSWSTAALVTFAGPRPAAPFTFPPPCSRVRVRRRLRGGRPGGWGEDRDGAAGHPASWTRQGNLPVAASRSMRASLAPSSATATAVSASRAVRSASMTSMLV
jgi:hypothetical protein